MKKKAYKAEDEEEENEVESPEDEEEEEEEMNASKAKKSEDLTQDDLQKSLEKLENVVSEGDKTTRKSALLQKAQTEDLDDEEKTELLDLLGKSEKTEEPTLGETVTKSMDDNESLQKALDVSDYLQENQSELKKSLGALADHIEKSDNRQHEFNLILAKAVSDIGRHVQGMTERMGIIERQPARSPKSRGVQPLQKGFGGSPAPETQLSKGEIIDGLMDMVQTSVQKGMNGALADGTDLISAVSKYEQFNSISPGLLRQVTDHINNNGTAR